MYIASECCLPYVFIVPGSGCIMSFLLPQKKDIRSLHDKVWNNNPRSFKLGKINKVQALCLSVDACLSYGLKRRALGLFKIRYEKSI